MALALLIAERPAQPRGVDGSIGQYTRAGAGRDETRAGGGGEEGRGSGGKGGEGGAPCALRDRRCCATAERRHETIIKFRV